MNALPTRRTTFPSRPSVKPNRVAGAKSSCPGAHTADKHLRLSARRGFTLVEMLVAIGILLVLMVITIAAVNVTMDSDRIKSGARSMQSYFAGARDRAIFAGRPRGVRIQLDPDLNPADPTTWYATSLVYIEAPEVYSEATIEIGGGSNDLVLPDPVANWERLRGRGMIAKYAAIFIREPGTAAPGNFYTVFWNGTAWQLTKPYVGPPGSGKRYEMYLTPVVLPNQEPRTLPRGIAIYLNNDYKAATPKGSKLPDGWANNTPLPADSLVEFKQPLDVIFSPRGTVTGLLASHGTIHLRLVDRLHVSNNPSDPTEGRDEFLVTLRTQTGKISTHPVNIGNPADPFLYAELGEGSGP